MILVYVLHSLRSISHSQLLEVCLNVKNEQYIRPCQGPDLLHTLSGCHFSAMPVVQHAQLCPKTCVSWFTAHHTFPIWADKERYWPSGLDIRSRVLPCAVSLRLQLYLVHQWCRMVLFRGKVPSGADVDWIRSSSSQRK